MSANRTISIIGVLLALIAVLAVTGPALAHPGEPLAPIAGPASPASAATTPPAAAVTPEDPPASESPELIPWIAPLVLLLVGLLLRRSSRRTLVLSLVLLLTLFAFENALHSVHHGFDGKQGPTCTLAMASAHLSAVTVDGVVETSIVLAAAGHAPPPGRSVLPARWLGPDQGRAPPARTA
jgi:hypothetical protein